MRQNTVKTLFIKSRQFVTKLFYYQSLTFMKWKRLSGVYQNKGNLYTWCSIQTGDISLCCHAAAVESHVDIHSKTGFF